MKKTKHRKKLDAEEVLTWKLSPIIPDLKFMWSSKQLIRHTEKLSYNDLYCSMFWLNLELSFSFILLAFAYKQKKFLKITLRILPTQKQGWGSLKCFSLEKRFTD